MFLSYVIHVHMYEHLLISLILYYFFAGPIIQLASADGVVPASCIPLPGGCTPAALVLESWIG